MQSDNSLLRRMVQDTLIDLIATGLAQEAGSTAEISLPEQHIMLRACSLIFDNLHDVDFDRTEITNRMG